MTNKMRTLDDLLTEKYGAIGTEARIAFENRAKAFALGEMLKEQRQKAKLTQQELANKIGEKKDLISKIEIGDINVPLSMIFRVVEMGLNKQLQFSII